MAATSPEPAGGQAPMLRPFDELRRYTIGAADGDVGEVIDAYFDDASWTVRHLVVDTGRWLPGRQVLISPCVVTAVDAAGAAGGMRSTVSETVTACYQFVEI